MELHLLLSDPKPKAVRLLPLAGIRGPASGGRSRRRWFRRGVVVGVGDSESKGERKQSLRPGQVSTTGPGRRAP